MAAAWETTLKGQVRHDVRENRPSRQQYRLQIDSAFTVSDAVSFHSMLSSGDGFGSSHNTFGQTSVIYLRRFFARYENNSNRTEVGVIPTYKGRVSSSGLSKHGWINGIRLVRQVSSNHQLEWVTGDLSNTDAKNAFALPNSLNYFELELSSQWSEIFSTELSFEHMTENSFLRTENRYDFSTTSLILEYIYSIDNNKPKYVVGIDTQLHIQDYPIAVFGHYSYVAPGFGPRARLTEDFLGVGHGFSLELKGKMPNASNNASLGWFTRYDSIEDVQRWMLGLSFKL